MGRIWNSQTGRSSPVSEENRRWAFRNLENTVWGPGSAKTRLRFTKMYVNRPLPPDRSRGCDFRRSDCETVGGGVSCGNTSWPGGVGDINMQTTGPAGRGNRVTGLLGADFWHNLWAPLPVRAPRSLSADVLATLSGFTGLTIHTVHRNNTNRSATTTTSRSTASHSDAIWLHRPDDNLRRNKTNRSVTTTPRPRSSHSSRYALLADVLTTLSRFNSLAIAYIEITQTSEWQNRLGPRPRYDGSCCRSWWFAGLGIISLT